jgi:hypothetical protein
VNLIKTIILIYRATSLPLPTFHLGMPHNRAIRQVRREICRR